MDFRPLGSTGFSIAPLVLGGNVFGWTADEPTSFAVLDAFVDGGVHRHRHRGRLFALGARAMTATAKRSSATGCKARGNRDKVHVFTKVGSDMGQGKNGSVGASGSTRRSRRR